MAINAQLASRLAQFKEWKAAKNSGARPQYGDSYAVEIPNPKAPSVPQKHMVRKPINPMIPRNDFDFPALGSESHGKIAWISRNPRSCCRIFKEASEVISRLPQGYYVDEFCDETISGFVVQIPGHKKTERWLAGTQYSDSDMAKIHLNEIFDCAEDAARSADHEAEKLAEQERDYREHEEDRAKEAAKADAAKKLAEIEWASKLITTCMKAVNPLIVAMQLGVSDDDMARLVAACETLEKLCDAGELVVENDWNEFRD